MSAVSKSLGRTVKTNIVLYSTDNMGRDGYITYNNGGFWKDNIKQIKLKSNFPRHINSTFHSLIHQAAPFNYYSDGRGRDTYVIQNNAGLVKEFNPLANRQILSKYLRKHIPFSSDKKIKHRRLFFTPSDRENFFKIREIQSNVVRRLYDQCLGKFREKMKSLSPIDKDILYNVNTSNNFPYLNNEKSLNKGDTKTLSKKEIENAYNSNRNQTKKILKFKMNKTFTNNLYNPKNLRQKSAFGNLKINNISNNNLNKYLTVNNTSKNMDIKNTFNTGSSENWNPILNKYNNTIINFKTKNNDNSFNNYKKNKIKQDLNQSDLNEIDKINNTMKIEVDKERPKSYRRFFQKTQIFNNAKPFLVDDFMEYSDYEQ